MKIPTQIWIFCVGIFLQHYTFLQKRTFCILCENFSRFVRKATIAEILVVVSTAKFIIKYKPKDKEKITILASECVNNEFKICNEPAPHLNTVAKQAVDEFFNNL